MVEASGKPVRAPTLMDVARRAGVSRATASLVLRKSDSITLATRARVEVAMSELGYVYNRGAARLRASRGHTIGVLLPNLANPFFATLLAGVEDRVEAAQLSVMLGNCNEDLARQERFLTRMREQGIDGLIVCPVAASNAQTAERLRTLGMPVVQLLRYIDGFASDFAGVDFAALVERATKRLIALGHRRIAFVSGNLAHSVQTERLAGFQTAMRGAALDASCVLQIPLTHIEGRRAAATLLGADAPPTAVLCFNDVVALGLHRGLVDMGVVIGRDVSLVGIDDVAECELVVPALASVATHPFRIGGNAADLLLRRLEHPETPFERRIEPTDFVERPSCGPALPLGSPRP